MPHSGARPRQLSPSHLAFCLPAAWSALRLLTRQAPPRVISVVALVVHLPRGQGAGPCQPHLTFQLMSRTVSGIWRFTKHGFVPIRAGVRSGQTLSARTHCG